MSQTQFWALIADIYSPLLVAGLLFQIAQRARRAPAAGPVIWAWSLRTVAFLAIIYGLRGIDALLGLWPYFSLDYSTHTAFAFIFSWLLWQSSGNGQSSGTRQRGPVNTTLAVAFISYLTLMYFLKYHTVLDMLSTLTVVAPLLALTDRGLFRLEVLKPAQQRSTNPS